MMPPDPEKGFDFRKGSNGAQQPSAESLSTMQKVIRYAEKVVHIKVRGLTRGFPEIFPG